jgi:hypothetical protein
LINASKVLTGVRLRNPRMRMSAFDFILTNCFQGIQFKFKTCQVQPQNPSQAGVLGFRAITDEKL